MVSSQDITSFVCACGVPGAVWQEQHMELYSCWNRTFPSDLAGNQTWRTITVFDGNKYKLSMNGYDSVMFLELDGRLERGSGFQVTFNEFVMLTAYRLPAEHSRPAMRQAALQPQRHQRGINMINYSLKILPVCCLACLQDISLPYARSCCQHPRHLNFTLHDSWKPIRNRISPLIKFHSVPLFKFLLKLT